MNATTDVAKEKLVKDFKAVVADTEELLKATASQTGDKVAAARARRGKPGGCQAAARRPGRGPDRQGQGGGPQDRRSGA